MQVVPGCIERIRNNIELNFTPQGPHKFVKWVGQAGVDRRQSAARYTIEGNPIQLSTMRTGVAKAKMVNGETAVYYPFIKVIWLYNAVLLHYARTYLPNDSPRAFYFNFLIVDCVWINATSCGSSCV
jgi:hypothetical protein